MDSSDVFGKGGNTFIFLTPENLWERLSGVPGLKLHLNTDRKKGVALTQPHNSGKSLQLRESGAMVSSRLFGASTQLAPCGVDGRRI